MLEWNYEVRQYPVIAVSFFRIINRDPDIVCFIRVTDDSSGGTGLLHKRAGIRADNSFTA